MWNKTKLSIKIYNENKKHIYWFLLRECSWLSREEVYEVMSDTCRIFSENIDEVYNLHSEFLQRKWLLKLAHDQAVKYIKEEEVNG